MKKLKTGDVLSISTTKGLAYLHYVGVDRHKIDHIRVLDGTFESGCDNLELLVKNKERFCIGFPLRVAYRMGIVKVAGFFPSDSFGIPRYTRSPHVIRGDFLGWHIIDTATLKRKLVENLSVDDIKLSPSWIINDTLLIDWLEQDFSLEKWNNEYILDALKKSALSVETRL